MDYYEVCTGASNVSLRLLCPRKRQPHALLKYFGGKHKLAPWIVSLLPTKNFDNYFLSDIDDQLMNFYNCLISDTFEEFYSRLQKIEYSKENFELYTKKQPSKGFIDDAVRFLVKARFSRSGMGKTFSWSERLRGNQPGDKNGWDNFILKLPILRELLSGENVHIYLADMLDILPRIVNDSNNLIYIDPPYLKYTRVSKNVYDFEMTEEQHQKLLKICKPAAAKIFISGYESEMYNSYLLKNDAWVVHKKIVPNHSGQTKKKNDRTELIYTNHKS